MDSDSCGFRFGTGGFGFKVPGFAHHCFAPLFLITVYAALSVESINDNKKKRLSHVHMALKWKCNTVYTTFTLHEIAGKDLQIQYKLLKALDLHQYCSSHFEHVAIIFALIELASEFQKLLPVVYTFAFLFFYHLSAEM